MDEDLIETEMVELGKLRYRHRVARNAKHGAETTDPVTRHAMASAVPAVAQAIDDWRRSARDKPGRLHRALAYIERMPADVIALLALKSLLDSASQSKTMLKAANSIARVLEDEDDFRTVIKQEPVLWAQLQRQVRGNINEKQRRKFISKTIHNHNLGISKWPPKDRANVGILLVELVSQATDFLKIENIRNERGKTLTMVGASDTFLDYIRKNSEKAELMSPVWLPMVEPPMDWRDPFVGGYQARFFRRRPLVKIHSRNYLNDLKGRDMAFVYKAVNAIQRTAWEVNPYIIDIVRQCWDRGVEIGDIPRRDEHPYPEKPDDIKENAESRRQYRKNYVRVKWANQHLGSKRMQLAKMLWVAKEFQDRPIYFPGQLDFRGRYYPMPGYLNPQGFDAARAGLRFRESVKINDDGEWWLRVHGANCYGLDKKPYVERLQWSKDFHDDIMGSGMDPMSHIGFWNKADKPFEFLAFCDEYSRMHRFPGEYRTQIPVSIDGSNNALQLISLLLRDEIGAEATNCVACEIPADIYRMVADQVVHELSFSQHEYAKAWAEVGIARSCLKRPVMTKPYAATLYSCKQYIGEWLHDELDRRRKLGLPVPFTDVYAPSMWLARIVHQVIDRVVPGVAALMRWLQEVSDICVRHDIPISWTSPSGFWIRQHYPKWKREEVRCAIGPKIRVHAINIEDRGMNKRANRNAITANFTHALDASLMVWSTNRLHDLHGIQSVSWIHDQASTHAPYVSILQNEIKESAIEVFSMDILGTFKAEVTAMLPPGVTIPDPPERGSFDLNRLRSADYFFA